MTSFTTKYFSDALTHTILTQIESLRELASSSQVREIRAAMTETLTNVEALLGIDKLQTISPYLIMVSTLNAGGLR